MNFLIIDTSTEKSFVAHYKDGTLKIEYLASGEQSQTLLPIVEKLLEAQEIEWIAVGTGPGSFTGTRVGVMGAKALAFAKGVPLVPFCSLKIFTPDEEGPFTLYGDGKSLGFYLLQGERSKKGASFEAPCLSKEGGSIATTLNLSFLTSYLIKKFQEKGGVSYNDVSPTYLSSL